MLDNRQYHTLGWANAYPINRCASIMTGGPGSYAYAPDFENANPARTLAVYQGQVTITMNGRYYRDFRDADLALGGRTPLWTWHHVYDMAPNGAGGQSCRMQLVTRAEHNWSKSHYGAVHQWQAGGHQPSYRGVAENLFMVEHPFIREMEPLSSQESEQLARVTGWNLSPLWERVFVGHKAMLGGAYKIQYEGEEGSIPADGLELAEICIIMADTQEGAYISKELPGYFPFAQDVFGNNILGHGSTGKPIYLLNHETGEFHGIDIKLADLFRAI